MPSLFLHRISVVRVNLSIAATTQDPAGRDPHQLFTEKMSLLSNETVSQPHIPFMPNLYDES